MGQALLNQRRKQLNISRTARHDSVIQQLEQRRQTSAQQPQNGAVGWLVPIATAVSGADRQTVENDPETAQCVCVQTVRCYPSIALAAMRERREASFRIWQLGRLFDPNGAGWIAESDLKKALCDESSPHFCFTWRRARQLFILGEGTFWDRSDGRLWLYGAACVARNLSVERLEGKPVNVPIKALTGSIKQVRAAFMDAFHSGRKRQNPISRETLRNLSSWAESTQRGHDETAGIQAQGNLAISGEVFSAETLREAIWQRKGGVFEFYDNNSKQLTLAWRLPNTYTGSLTRARRGRNRKINQQLKLDLVDYAESGGTGGNGLIRLFHKNGATAAKSVCRNGGQDAYWQCETSRGGAGVWRCLAN